MLLMERMQRVGQIVVLVMAFISFIGLCAWTLELGGMMLRAMKG